MQHIFIHLMISLIYVAISSSIQSPISRRIRDPEAGVRVLVNYVGFKLSRVQVGTYLP